MMKNPKKKYKNLLTIHLPKYAIIHAYRRLYKRNIIASRFDLIDCWAVRIKFLASASILNFVSFGALVERMINDNINYHVDT